MTELIQRLKKVNLLERFSLSALLVLMLSVLMCFLAINTASAQSGLACDNLVNVSLNDMCESEIRPSIMLENTGITESEYEVSICDLDGKAITTDLSTDGFPIVDGSHVGETLSVKVKKTGSLAECWGNILVEAKHGRLFENCINGYLVDAGGEIDTLKLECGELDSLNNLDFPDLNSDCASLSVDSSHADAFGSQPCFSGDYIDLIFREWTATTKNGYKSSCKQVIAVIAPTMSNIKWPPHYDSDTLIKSDDAKYPNHRQILSCDFIIGPSGTVGNVGNTIFNDDGSPSPETTGYPSEVECRNVQTTYKDAFIPICGSGFKILREWSLLNWCTGQVVKYHQIIKLVDDRGPIATCPTDDIIVDTDPWSCLGTINPLPDPIQIFDCSATTYTVSYKLRDENGDPYDNPITDNVIDNGNGTYGIRDLPQDSTWVVYTITDECGFSTQCFTEIFVKDSDAPNAICEDNTIISLDLDGKGKMPAQSLDDHSYDNCGIVKYEARKKDDIIYRDTLMFDCSDIGPDGVRVALKVYDAEGQSGECWVFVKVQNKQINVLKSCPNNTTVDCNGSTAPNSTGRPTLDQSCITATMDYEDSGALMCGEGTITRLWTITDMQGDKQTCTQIITVKDQNPFSNLDIKWPDNQDLDGCSFTSTDPDNTGRPEFVNQDCVSLTVGYEDESFELVDGCKKIIREWTVIDWCRYDANFPLDKTRWSYSQSLKISNTQKPVFVTGCDDFEVNAGDECKANVTVSALAEDDCSGRNDLVYRWEIDVNYNGSFSRSRSGLGSTQTSDYNIGTHAVKWYVKDECGNEETCMQVFHVIDTSIPSFTCVGFLSLSLSNDGWVEIWASDFIKDVTGKCSGQDQSNFTFSFDENTFEPNEKIDCADFYNYSEGNGVNYLEELKVYVFNNDAVVDFCTVNLRVTDNFDKCPDFGTTSASISGKITTENNEGLQDLEVKLKNIMDDSELLSRTSTKGEYAFSGVGLYDDYIINPEVNDMAVNGVSTLDIVLIQQHILGLKPLDSPHKQIAADINRSGSISASDLVVARKLILGLIDEFPESESWRFIDASHNFESENGMINYPEQIDFQNVIESKEDANFIGIKIGDVNESVQTSLTETEVRSRPSVSFQVKDMAYEAGEEYILPVILDEQTTQGIQGLQLDLEFNERMVEILGVSAGDLDLNKDNYIIEDGRIRISWNSIKPISLSEKGALFFINLKTKTQNYFSNTFEVVEHAIASEFIDEDLVAKSIDLTFGEDGLLNGEFTLFQNKPNPFVDKTVVSFNLPQSGQVSLKVFDTKGQLVMQAEKDFEKGLNELELNFEGVSHSGILYLNLVAGKYSANTKMVLIK